jgi:hypothetical protein
MVCVTACESPRSVLLLLFDAGCRVRRSAERAGAAPAECPEVFPVAEIETGMQAEGWTVEHGNVPQPFAVEVLGVLRDGIALGRDMIIVEIADEPGSTMIARAGGIWAGMSGSPVYVGDRLLGAVAWAFGVGPSRVGGVTAPRTCSTYCRSKSRRAWRRPRPA